MPLDTLGMFFYFSLLVILYGSPVILLVLVFRYRQDKLFNGIVSVLLGVPFVALITMIGFRMDLWQAGFERDRQEAQLNEVFDRSSAITKYSGFLIDSFERSGYIYSRYQFGSGSGRFELILPPGNVTSVAELRYEPESLEPGSETAQLWLLGSEARYDPVGNDRNQYFTEHLGVPEPNQQIIFMRLYPVHNSSAVYWTVDEQGGRWRNQMLIIDWSSLP